MKGAVLVAASLIGAMAMQPEVGGGIAPRSSIEPVRLFQNVDRRTLCRARTEKQDSRCGVIQNADLRNLCRAEVAGDRSSCGFIKDANM